MPILAPRRHFPASPVALCLVHYALTASPVLYAAIYKFALLAPGALPSSSHPNIPNLPHILLLLGLAMVPLGLFVPSAIDRAAAPADGAEIESRRFAARAMAKLVVSDACFEAIAVYGLVGGVLGAPPKFVFLQMGLGFFFLLANTARLRASLQEYEDIRRREGD